MSARDREHLMEQKRQADEKEAAELAAMTPEQRAKFLADKEARPSTTPSRFHPAPGAGAGSNAAMIKRRRPAGGAAAAPRRPRRPQAPDWQELQTPEGWSYFYNSTTGEVTRENPNGGNGAAAASDWTQAQTPEGYTYWYNASTGESS
ncbi:hypothetical protein JL720_15165 [Aureococcus anophagefferens]|nr:hypothetical protein JL720_15165 [Aureococcus anophagefferens]